jgi:hypothetical protein
MEFSLRDFNASRPCTYLGLIRGMGGMAAKWNRVWPPYCWDWILIHVVMVYCSLFSSLVPLEFLGLIFGYIWVVVLLATRAN